MIRLGQIWLNSIGERLVITDRTIDPDFGVLISFRYESDTYRFGSFQEDLFRATYKVFVDPDHADAIKGSL